MPPPALISSAAMCSTLETVFSEIAMPPVRELRKPSLMVSPEVSTQLGAADLPPDASSPARAPQPASTRATIVAMVPVATSGRSRLLVVDICGTPFLVKEAYAGVAAQRMVRVCMSHAEPPASRAPRQLPPARCNRLLQVRAD